MINLWKDVSGSHPVGDWLPVICVLSPMGGSTEQNLWVKTDSWPAGAILSIAPIGADLTGENAQASVSVKLGATPWTSVLPNAPLMTNQAANSSPLPITIRVKSVSGGVGVLQQMFLRIILLDGTSSPQSVDFPLQVHRVDVSLGIRCRVLAPEDQLQASTGGFLLGTSRWKSINEVNAAAFTTPVPTETAPPITEGLIAGVLRNTDMEFAQLERVGKSVYARIRHGCYSTGPDSYYCPSDVFQSEIFPVSDSALRFQLRDVPRRQLPLFVGTFQQDSRGYFNIGVNYRSCLPNAGFDDASSDYQFIVDRRNKSITINRAPNAVTAFAGFVPNTSSTILQLPVYPVWNLHRVYVDGQSSACSITNFNQEAGTVEVTFPAGVTGQRIYVEYDPALLIQYESESTIELPNDGTLLIPADLNPAFSGLTKGTVYVMHRNPKPNQVVLYADKPRLNIAPTFGNQTGLVAYGPVYYQDDYALLMARVTGVGPQDVLQGIRLHVVPQEDFQGQINYQDPTKSDVTVMTGADGTATFLYTPTQPYGFYLSRTDSVQGADTLLLPEPVALSQIWDAVDGWYLKSYIVRCDNPMLGSKTANTGIGEVLWTEYGAPNTPQYQTNGMRQVWMNGLTQTVPLQLFDSSNHPAFDSSGHLNPAFNGLVSRIQYELSLPTDSSVGAFYVGFIGRIWISLREETTGLMSNTLILQLEPPAEVYDSPSVSGYLYLNRGNDILQGRLNVNRLGGAPLPQSNIYTQRY